MKKTRPYRNIETGEVWQCRRHDGRFHRDMPLTDYRCGICGRPEREHASVGWLPNSLQQACPGQWVAECQAIYKIYDDDDFRELFDELEDMVTAENYVEHVLRTAHGDIEAVRKRLQDPKVLDLLHSAIGLGTEAGEMLDVLKKHIWYGKPIDWTNVVEELGDTCWYVGLGCHAADATLKDALEINIKKLDARYRGGFTEEKARNRNLKAERAILEGKDLEGDSTCDHCGLARPRKVLENDGNGLWICDRCRDKLGRCPACNGQGHYTKSQDSLGTFGGTCEWCRGLGWVKKEYLCEHGQFEELCEDCHPERDD